MQKHIRMALAAMLLVAFVASYSLRAHADLVSPDGKGKLTVIDAEHGKYKVHLEGTSYAMGYQHGYLLAEQVRTTCSADFCRGVALNMLGGEEAIREILENDDYFAVILGVVETAALSQSVYATLSMQTEMQGIVAGAKARLTELGQSHGEISYSRVVLANFAYDVLLSYGYPFAVMNFMNEQQAAASQAKIKDQLHACDGFIALSSATETGGTIMGRSFMIPAAVVADSVVMEYKPLIGNRFVACNIAGFVGTPVAMNSYGICIGMDMLPTLYTNPIASGMGTLLTARYAVQYKSNVPAALDAIKNSVARGCPWIYLVAGPSSGAVAEAGATYGLGWWENQSDYFAARYTDYYFDGAQHPQYPEVNQTETRSDLVVTANHFIDPTVTNACGAWAIDDSIGRYNYLTGIVQQAIDDGERITVQEAKEITNYLSPLSSYGYWHYSPGKVHGIRAVFDIANMDMHVLWGHDWSDPWITYSW